MSGAVGAVFGGLATSWMTQYLTRPRLSCRVFDIEITPFQPNDQLGIAEEIVQKGAKDYLITPRETIEVFERHNWLKVPGTEYQHPLLFTWDLYKANRDNELLRLQQREIPNVLRELRTLLQTDQQLAFCNLYARHQSILWSHIYGEARRGCYLIETAPTEDRPDLLPRYPDAKGDIFINLGRLLISLPWSNEKIHVNNVQLVAQSFGKALSQWDKGRLGGLLTKLESTSWNDPLLTETANHIEATLLRFSRVIVRGAITNSGRTGASVLGVGTLALDSRGFALARGNGPEITRDITVPCHMLNEDKVSILSALSVPPGEAVPFTASSDYYIFKSGIEQELLGLYGSERNCKLTLINTDSSALTSQDIVFGPNRALAAARA